jgi:ribosome-binding factor A
MGEAIGSLNDSVINGVTVTDVVCSRGKSDATVFIFDSGYDKNEKKEILSRLKKASSAIGVYCLAAEGWYKMPRLSFEFDESIEKIQKIEKLFEQIKKKNSEQ